MRKIFAFLAIVSMIIISCSKEVGPAIDMTPEEPQDTSTTVDEPDDTSGVSKIEIDLVTGEVGSWTASYTEEADHKVVLIEEFTGINCNNCPTAHRAVKDIMDGSENVKAISFHVGNFANPDFSSNFDVDLRTTDGAALVTALSVNDALLPVGMVDRFLFDGESALEVGMLKWAGYAGQRELESTPVNIEVNVESYNETSKTVTFTVRAYFTDTLSGDVKLSVAIAEDKVVTPQIDGADWISEYEQPHVFRDMISPVEGESLDGTKEVGSSYAIRYAYKIDGGWDASHCHIIAHIHRPITEGRKIIQAEDVHVIAH